MHYLKRAYIVISILLISMLTLSACTKNAEGSKNVFATSNNSPQIEFWVSLQADDDTLKTGEPYIIEVSFGTRAHNLERYVVTVDSADFDVSKDCPDEYIVDGESYTDDDFYVDLSEKEPAENLPQRFNVSLTPKDKKDMYLGYIKITIVEHLVGGRSTGSAVLYYYGNDSIICFSSVSQKNAERVFNLNM